jgi:hypothetical protein
MTDVETATYVDAACAVQGLVLPAEARARVLEQFARIATIAAPVLALGIPPEVEPANVFLP